MASGWFKGIVLDTSALEKVMGTGARPLVNKHAQSVQQRVNGMSAGFRTGRYYDRPSKQLRGGKAPQYGVKLASSDTNPHALVYTANYAAMRFEHDNNGLLKASR